MIPIKSAIFRKIKEHFKNLEENLNDTDLKQTRNMKKEVRMSHLI